MIYSISGKLIIRKPNLAIIESNGIGFKIVISKRTFRELPKTGSRVRLFCHLRAYENEVALYGFVQENDLEIFELLNSINGIGPRAALRLQEVMSGPKLLGAVKSGRVDLLSEAAGVGAKKAARIIMELKDKISRFSKIGSQDLELDLDLEAVLKSLGYKQKEVKIALAKISEKTATSKLEERLRAALKILAGK